MTNRKAVCRGVYIIEAKNITEEEKAENKAKFDAWFDDFIKTWGNVESENRN